MIKALKENEQGRSVGDLSRELGIDKSTFYYWRKKYGGMDYLINLVLFYIK
ncbi:transposase, partial [Tamlana haliotis]